MVQTESRFGADERTGSVGQLPDSRGKALRSGLAHRCKGARINSGQRRLPDAVIFDRPFIADTYGQLWSCCGGGLRWSTLQGT